MAIFAVYKIWRVHYNKTIIINRFQKSRAPSQFVIRLSDSLSFILTSLSALSLTEEQHIRASVEYFRRMFFCV